MITTCSGGSRSDLGRRFHRTALLKLDIVHTYLTGAFAHEIRPDVPIDISLDSTSENEEKGSERARV